MKYGLYAFIAFCVSLIFVYTPVGAQQALRIQPLEQRVSLAIGEKKKGFVDITNPTETPLSVTMSVQGFRQTGNNGALEFYTNDAISKGIILDFTEFELKARETIRLYFLIDGSRLPTGDVFAGIFATGQPTEGDSMVRSSVRVGMLLSVENGTPDARQAGIVHAELPFFQFGDRLTGRYVIKNLAPANQTTGFYPTVSIAVSPFHSQHQVTSDLVFAGRSRTNEFSVNEHRFGLYKVSVSYQGSVQSRWVFMATGPWAMRGLIGVLLVVVASVLFFMWRRSRAGRRTHTSK